MLRIAAPLSHTLTLAEAHPLGKLSKESVTFGATSRVYEGIRAMRGRWKQEPLAKQNEVKRSRLPQQQEPSAKAHQSLQPSGRGISKGLSPCGIRFFLLFFLVYIFIYIRISFFGYFLSFFFFSFVFLKNTYSYVLFLSHIINLLTLSKKTLIFFLLLLEIFSKITIILV